MVQQQVTILQLNRKKVITSDTVKNVISMCYVSTHMPCNIWLMNSHSKSNQEVCHKAETKKKKKEMCCYSHMQAEIGVWFSLHFELASLLTAAEKGFQELKHLLTVVSGSLVCQWWIELATSVPLVCTSGSTLTAWCINVEQYGD